MILSDLLGVPVTDPAGAPLGRVADARFVLDGPLDGQLAAARLFGLLVSPHTGSSFLGYERRTMRAPYPIAVVLRWRHRGIFLLRWEDVERVDRDGVHARPGWTRYDATID